MLFFPESGLSLCTGEISGLHAVMVPRPISPAYSLEVGLPGAPRALSLVAVPDCSDMASFTGALLRQSSTAISECDLSEWQADHAASTEMCPCCKAAAKDRQDQPEKHPLARVLQHAVRERLPLMCRLVSPHLSFSTWITPQQFQTGDGRITAVDTGGRGLLEIHVGYVHSLWTLQRKVDGENYALLKAFNPTGRLHLEIATPHVQFEPVWRELCRYQAS